MFLKAWYCMGASVCSLVRLYMYELLNCKFITHFLSFVQQQPPWGNQYALEWAPVVWQQSPLPGQHHLSWPGVCVYSSLCNKSLISTNLHTSSWLHSQVTVLRYCIAGNFQGRKDATSQKFAEKTFANSFKIHKKFLPQKFLGVWHLSCLCMKACYLMQLKYTDCGIPLAQQKLDHEHVCLLLSSFWKVHHIDRVIYTILFQ